MPPTHNPFRFEAAILSRMRSPVTSRSNLANESSTFRVSRPIEVVVLNCWVTETNAQGAPADLRGRGMARVQGAEDQPPGRRDQGPRSRSPLAEDQRGAHGSSGRRGAGSFEHAPVP